MQITVNPVNDPPVLDLSSINPITLYHHTPHTIHMITGTHVTDIDGVDFTWDVVSPDTSILIAFFSGHSLHLEAIDETFVGNKYITIIVTDAESAADSQEVLVMIREVITIPPVIGQLPVIYKKPDSTYILNLNDYVTDEDTPLDQLEWMFQVFDEFTSQPDTNVYPHYIHETQRLEITSKPKHHVIDRLRATVYDEAQNSDTKSTRLLVFGKKAPLIAPFPEIIMVTDTTIEPVDLDTMVYDLVNTADKISWSIKGIDHLKSVTISGSTHIVTVASNSSFIGTDIITFIATNSLVASDTAYMSVRVVSRTPNPIMLQFPDATFFWREPLPQTYADLDDYVWDLHTPDSLIKWKIVYDSDFMNITVDDDNIARVTTKQRTGQTQVQFSATDTDNYVSTDLAIFLIKEDNGPAWQKLSEVILQKHEQLTLYELATICSDDRTPSSALLFGYETESPSRLNIEIEPQVTISLKDTTFLGTTWMRFSAEDAHGHKTWSNIVYVTTGKSQPPVWTQIPTIQFENNEKYRDLYLRKYCVDPENQKLIFDVTNVYPNELDVEIIDSTSQVYLGALRGFFGKLDLVFKATDPDSNTTATVVDILITDTDPPEGHLTYHYNPIASNRLKFIVISDATASSFKSSFYINSIKEDLVFKLIDSNLFEKIWAASYKFSVDGSYCLHIELINKKGLVNRDSLNWNIRLAKSDKGIMHSYDKKLAIEYPENRNVAQRCYMVMQDYSLNPGEKQEVRSPVYTVFSDETSDNVVAATYINPDRNNDLYYSFYDASDGELERIDTFVDHDGNFQAVLKKETPYVLGKSDIAAHRHRLPLGELLCFPNPFNNSIHIKFLLTKDSNVTLTIYNILGQTIYSQNETELNAGLHSLIWDGRSQYGHFLPSGIYFISVQTAWEKALLKKVTMIK